MESSGYGIKKIKFQAIQSRQFLTLQEPSNKFSHPSIVLFYLIKMFLSKLFSSPKLNFSLKFHCIDTTFNTFLYCTRRRFEKANCTFRPQRVSYMIGMEPVGDLAWIVGDYRRGGRDRCFIRRRGACGRIKVGYIELLI